MLIAAALPGVAMAQSGELAGDWDGSITIRAGMTLPLIFHLFDPMPTMESPEQSTARIPISVARNAASVAIDIAAVKARFEGQLSDDGKTIAGKFTQNGVEMAGSFTRRATGTLPAAADRPQTPKPPFPYQSSDVSIPSVEGVTLAGTLTRPNGITNPPAVVLIAGSGPQDRDEQVLGHRPFLVLADRLSRAGIAVLRYDKRGIGKSTGGYVSATTDDFTADAAAALAWLAMQPGIDHRHIGLIGHSEGAQIAPAVAHDPQAAFVVLLAPPGLTGDRVIVTQKRAIEAAMGVPAATIEKNLALQQDLFAVAKSKDDDATVRTKVIELMMAHGIGIGEAAGAASEAASPWTRRYLNYDPIPALKALTVPTLVVQGSLDMQVIPADNLPPIRAALAGHRDTSVVELPGLNHLLQPAKTGAPSEYRAIPTTVDESALTLIVDWVKAHGH